MIDWNNFLKSISICYHGNLQILSILMFMIFDESLSKQFTKDQVKNMIEYNI
jgi:hypothetical protein